MRHNRYDEYELDKPKDEDKFTKPKEAIYAKLMKVTSEYFTSINVRDEPSPSGKVIAVLKVGTEVFGSDTTENGFTKVLLENSQEGYMMTKFLETIRTKRLETI